MIDKIRNNINLMKGKRFIFKIRNIRNKSEIFCGTILEVYERLFVVSKDDGNNVSFMYADILVGNIEIKNEMC